MMFVVSETLQGMCCFGNALTFFSLGISKVLILMGSV